MNITKIKFKALFRQMASPQDVWLFSTVNSKDVDFLNFMQKSEWLQYTGLQDRTGREIYEGDLLKWGDSVVEVVFESGSFKTLNDGDSEMLLWYCVPDCEVIGSKYEKNVKL